ncbi:cysteine proteinase [Guyanagaster necrorhizus]|uniref:Cysteine proteinase n=1 Tax=Guyanagaster necrorhizus TaxID=856835 RepID=A0A9P8AXT2_9AGAR|nr:cysteine proteinase [Guyanagaster necrorhizus MCA 3950]KAG7450262.1 cysteine proteinase [Guyanagaster necrorhizus MCA 3950]
MPPQPSPSLQNAEAGPSRVPVESRQSSVAESLSVAGDGWQEQQLLRSVGQPGRDSQSPFQFSQNSSFRGSVSSSQGHPPFQFATYQPSSIPSNFRDTPLRKPRPRPSRRKGSMGPPPVPPARNTLVFPLSVPPSPQSSSSRSDIEQAPGRIQNPIHALTSHLSKIKHYDRPHIHAAQHKAQVAAEKTKDRTRLLTHLYNINKKQGYGSSFQEFDSLLQYRALLEGVDTPSRQRLLSASPSLTDLRSKSTQPIQPTRLRRHSDISEFPGYLRLALEKARATLNGPKPAMPFSPAEEQLRLKDRTKDAQIEYRLRGAKRKPLPKVLPDEDELKVKAFLKKSGVVSKYGREQVTGQDLQRLKPGQWLNDEIINFYGAMILGRSEASKENPAVNGTVKRKVTPLNVHYFSTFFWSKLDQDGYEKARLTKWTKKFDLFAKDMVLIPVNHNNMHWTAAAINFRRKRIESYDSMNMSRQLVFKLLRHYLDAEHRNKKKKPFDFTGWEDYTLKDTPQQENGYDCGVFTCQFLQSLSKGEESFNFSQADIPYLRRRMILEIGQASLGDDL